MESVKDAQKVKRIFALPLVVFSFVLMLPFILINIQASIQNAFTNDYQTITPQGTPAPSVTEVRLLPARRFTEFNRV